MTDRQAMKAAQEELVRALVAGGEVPAGFDAARLNEQAAALHHKRRRGIERAVPELARALGDDFRAKFAEWARENPPRTDSCTRSDAAAFAAWAQPAAVRTSRRWWRSAPRAGARPARP